MAYSACTTRYCLGAHSLLLCLSLGLIIGIAGAQPAISQRPHVNSQGFFDNLSANGVGIAGLRVFMQRMQILVSGLIHVSILVLPHALLTKQEQLEGNVSESKCHENLTVVKSDKEASGNDEQGVLFHIKTNQEKLNRSLSCGLHWRSCPLYELQANAGPTIVCTPPFPLAASTSMDMLKNGEDFRFTDDFARLGPHYEDWSYLFHHRHAKSMATIAVRSAKSSQRQSLQGFLIVASTETAAFRELEASLSEAASALGPYVDKLLQIKQFPAASAFDQYLACCVQKMLAGKASSINDQFKTRQKHKIGKNHLKPNLYQNRNKDIQKRQGTYQLSKQPVVEKELPKQTAGRSSNMVLDTDEDLDWGDFAFNLVSMGLVYAYFSEAAIVGESRLEVSLSLGVACVDIIFLVLRWLWFERGVSSGPLTNYIFHIYRLAFLPAANSWMGWSLLYKFNAYPKPVSVVMVTIIYVVLLVAGCRKPALLQAPLQLASIILAATSAPHICSLAFQGNILGVKCMASVSVVQLVSGIGLPSLCTGLLRQLFKMLHQLRLSTH